MKIDVLDKGFVQLIDSMGTDLSIVRAARVSYDADWRAGEDEGKDTRLINYLIENNHSGPFESVVFTFEVKAPIFVLRQWHRHRTWSYNEVSARYTSLDEGFYIPDPAHITTQSKDNKQSRTDTAHQRAAWASHKIRNSCESAFMYYKELLSEGVPRELARSVLPVAAYSRMFGTVSLWNLMRFLRLRMHSHAQYEIRVYADALHHIAHTIVPVAMQAFDEIKTS